TVRPEDVTAILNTATNPFQSSGNDKIRGAGGSGALDPAQDLTGKALADAPAGIITANEQKNTPPVHESGALEITFHEGLAQIDLADAPTNSQNPVSLRMMGMGMDSIILQQGDEATEA